MSKLSLEDAAQLVNLAAQLLQITVVPEHQPGVIANLLRTAEIAELVMEFPLPKEIEVAATFDP